MSTQLNRYRVYIVNIANKLFNFHNVDIAMSGMLKQYQIYVVYNADISLAFTSMTLSTSQCWQCWTITSFHFQHRWQFFDIGIVNIAMYITFIRYQHFVDQYCKVDYGMSLVCSWYTLWTKLKLYINHYGNVNDLNNANKNNKIILISRVQ